MTLQDCAQEMRDRGLPCVPARLADEMEKGVCEFGIMKRKNKMRRTFEIRREDFEQWLERKVGEKT